ncbi:DMT family transporter [bacterium]|nr:DMT family transporter [bacterium]
MIYIKQLLTAFFWGGTFIAGRIVSRNLDPYSAAFLRFAIASVFLLFLIKVTEGKLPVLRKNQIFPIICLGMTGIFTYNILFFKGLHTVSAGRASLIIALNPIIISLLSTVFFKEKPTKVRLLGVLISVTGALIVITHGDLSTIFTNPLSQGDVFIFGCVASWVAYTLIGNKVIGKLSPLVSVGYSCLVGAIALFFPAMAHGVYGNIVVYTLEEWAALFFLGFFGTVLGFFWYYEGLKKIGPMKASVFINFVPISAIVLAYLILDEPVTLSLATGAIFVTCGVFLTNASGLLKKKRTKDR